jgi:uncharacterized protein
MSRNTSNKQKPAVQERRVTPNGDMRAVNKGTAKTIFGYAALFAPVQTQDMGGWREEVHPNAFDRCLRNSPDVVALFNHDSNTLPLARTTSGTLRLSIDDRGLRYELDTPDTNLGRDLSVLLNRGDIHQSSYGFICLSESWRNDIDGTPIRTVLDADLIDVSPVVFPATLTTTSGTRSIALRNAPAFVLEKLNVRGDESDDEDDECDQDESSQDCEEPEVCDEESDYFDRDECETERLRNRLRAAEARIADDAELETLRLRLRLATAQAKSL